jgi:formate dehydrogenase subunit gamma
VTHAASVTKVVLAAIPLIASMTTAAQARAQSPSAVDRVCAACHPGAPAQFARLAGHAGSTTCLTCHHIGYSDDPAIIRLHRLEACRSCHADLPVTHRTATGVVAICTDCHTIHADTAVTGSALVSEAACEACHGVPHTLHAAVKEGAPTCTDCHTLHGEQTEAGNAAPAGVQAGVSSMAASITKTCGSCHQAVHPSHAAVEEAGNLPCTRCHEMDAATPTARVASLLSAECRTCHATVQPAHGAVDRPILCTDCHDFASDPPLATADVALSLHCASCHPDAAHGLESGAHAVKLTEGSVGGQRPTCVSCHDVHDASQQNMLGVRIGATARCVRCHSNPVVAKEYGMSTYVATSYLQDFHGSTAEVLAKQTGKVSGPNVLVCSDCHRAHAVTKEPEEALSEVCVRCHEDASPNLASAWLGHGRVGPRHKPVIWAIRLFYTVLIPFVLVGLFLNIVFHLMDQRRRGARVWRAPGVIKIRRWLARRRAEREATVTRFNAVERLEHLGAMITFPLLALTGLPQVAPTSSVGSWVVHLFGGIGTIRIVHRATGFTFVALLFMHVSRGVRGVLKEHRLPAIVPRKQDFLDAVQTVRHLLRGEPGPKLGRFDASEKFEYWGLFFGGLLMSVTGLGLVFPQAVTWLLPGIVVAAMRTMHGLEATFAVLVVLLWHSYGVIFKPDIFPLDPSIFTGKISVDRLKDEHALEYEKLFPEKADAD